MQILLVHRYTDHDHHRLDLDETGHLALDGASSEQSVDDTCSQGESEETREEEGDDYEAVVISGSTLRLWGKLMYTKAGVERESCWMYKDVGNIFTIIPQEFHAEC